MRTETGYADISVTAPLPTLAGPVPVERFLLGCVDAVAGTPTDEQAAFLRAGRRALLAQRRWVQLGLAVDQPARGLYAALGELATSVLGGGLATEFFFMHKPPGLRIRFEPAPGQRDELAAAVRARVRRWQGRDLVGMVTAPGYEAETALFGGPASMRHVHGLFTADSLLWLDHHAEPTEPAWAHSLSVLAALFAGLGVVGWEDLDVWDRVRVQTHRRLPAELTGSPAFGEAAAGVRHVWARCRSATAHERVRAVADRWRREYFDTDEAELGPREAAALVTIFHWNRGALNRLRQGLLAESLADRTATTEAAHRAPAAGR